ncbi:MAG TPA: hypothetical protein VIM05_04485 [Gaiellaceae bacterium]
MLVFGTAGPAAAKGKPPCWKTLINDWYDGRIDGTYPIHCYRDALNHLPTDVETYSSARDDIKQALQDRITQGSKRGGSGPRGASGTSGGSGPNSSGPNSNGPNSSGPNANPGGGKTGSDKSAKGPINDIINAGKPGSADSVPVPLIVLGAVALLLMVAGGAGFLTRRMRTRKLQLASAATQPQHPGAPPPEQP